MQYVIHIDTVTDKIWFILAMNLAMIFLCVLIHIYNIITNIDELF